SWVRFWPVEAYVLFLEGPTLLLLVVKVTEKSTFQANSSKSRKIPVSHFGVVWKVSAVHPQSMAKLIFMSGFGLSKKSNIHNRVKIK
ncbi:17885_t:CDS:1, partial [Acaulospora morrowiae]